MYAVPNDFLNRINDLELKTRHVRTPEGVQRFNLPIGSPIVPHVDIAKPDLATAPRARTWRVKKDDMGREVMTSTQNSIRVELTHMQSGDVYDTADLYEVRAFHVARGGRQLSSEIFTAYSGTASGHKKAKDDALRIIAKALKHVPVMSTREESPFIKFYEGTYGYEWVTGDEGDHEYDPLDDDSRRWFAAHESEKLGITVSNFSFNDETYEADPNSHESVNTIMRIYEDTYPGFSNLIPEFIVQPNASNPIDEGMWLAFNRPIYTGKYNEVMSALVNALGDSHHHEMSGPQFDHTTISLASEYFGDSLEDADIYDRISKTYKRATDVGWFSVNATDIKNETGMEDWQAAMLTTLNHEIGHTVARIGFGELIAQEGVDPQKYQDAFWKKMDPLLVKYELISEYQAIGDRVDTNRDANAKEHMFLFNSNVVSGVVSQYATKSMHELFAEVWASYMMDPTPTQFTLEAGTIMESSLKQFLRDFYK